MDVDKLIEWLKKEDFDYPSTFEKLKEEQFNGHIFCSASDDDLAKLDPSLKKGPQIQLRTLRDKLKRTITETGTSPKPPVPSPAPRPESTSAVPTPTGEGQSGENSQEYKAVKNNFSDITKTIRMTPSALEDMWQKFVQEDWLDPSRKPNEKELVTLVLSRIMKRVSEFRVFVAILRSITGLDLIADKLEEAVQSRSSCAPSAAAVQSVTKQQPMTHPVYDFRRFGEPNLSSLMNLVGMRVRNKWYAIGGGLGVEVTELESFQTEEAGKTDATQNCMRRVFQKWHSAITSEYSWQNLVDVLQSRAVDEKKAVEELYKSLCELQKN